jgi:YVTN family beta-propeller protein
VWAAAGAKPTVVSIDAASGRVLRRYPLDRAGSWMLETGGPQGAIVVAQLEGGALTLLDPASGAQRVLPLREGQIDAAPTRDAAFVWSVNLTDSTLTVIDARTRSVLSRQIVGGHPVRVIMTPDGRRALVVNEDRPAIIAFDVRTRARVGTAMVRAGPKVIALSADGRRAYVTHPDANALTMVDVASLTVLKTVELPGTPDGVAVVGSTSTRRR